MGLSNKLKIVLNIVSVVLAITLMAFQGFESRNYPVNKLNVRVLGNESQPFLNQEDIEEFVHGLYDSIYRESIREINITLLEDTIEHLTYVDNAEVYSTLDGELSVIVNQNRAIARVKDEDKWYYMDENGKRMPLSRHYSAMVPLITGEINEQNLTYSRQLLLNTSNDPFFEGYIQGIHFKNNGKIRLYPSFGNHRVEWGYSKDTDGKLTKLKAFYSNLQNDEELRNIRTINTEYEGQVVYTNR